jgi:hypothetical protein
MDWYFGNIDRKEAESLLKREARGGQDVFLVRDSSLTDHSYAVSVFHSKTQSVSHTLITRAEYGSVYYQLQDSARLYTSVYQLIKKAPELATYKGIVRSSRQALTSNSGKTNSTENLDQTVSTIPTPTTPVSSSSSLLLDLVTLQQEVKQLLEEKDGNNNGSTSSARNKLLQLKQTLKSHIQKQQQKIQQLDKLLVQQR